MELTIIVPVYNVEKYLRECLNSIYSIKNIDYEVILVNDGSTDNSLTILNEYRDKYFERTKIINKKNGGLSSARNIGIENSKGEYISFIDSDDIIDAREYEKFFREGKELNLDIMVGNLKYFSDKKIGEPLFRSEQIKKLEVVEGTVFFKTLFQNKKCFREEVVDDIYRREFLCKNNLYFLNDILHEDSLFTPKVYLKAKKVKYIDRAFYLYRQRSGSIMSKVTDNSINSLEKICLILLDEYKNTNKDGKEALSKLLPSFYKVVLYRYINLKRNYKEKLNNYRKIYRETLALENGNKEELLVYFFPKLAFNLRKFIGKEIGSKQKIPKF